MFDRYPGDNNTKLSTQEKLYLDSASGLVLPAINVFSMLAARNTRSACKHFFGKQGTSIAQGMAAFTNIEPVEIPIVDDKDEQIFFKGWNEKISIHKAVARLEKGIPNPKERPVIALPWNVHFDLLFEENEECTLENLRTAMKKAGILGLGTYRPFYGTFVVSQWDEVEQ